MKSSRHSGVVHAVFFPSAMSEVAPALKEEEAGLLAAEWPSEL